MRFLWTSNPLGSREDDGGEIELWKLIAVLGGKVLRLPASRIDRVLHRTDAGCLLKALLFRSRYDKPGIGRATSAPIRSKD